jgi:hypothetical protein
MAFQPNTDQTLPLVVVVLIAAFSASFSSFIAPFFDLFESRNIYNEIYSSNLEIKSLTEI